MKISVECTKYPIKSQVDPHMTSEYVMVHATTQTKEKIMIELVNATELSDHINNIMGLVPTEMTHEEFFKSVKEKIESGIIL